MFDFKSIHGMLTLEAIIHAKDDGWKRVMTRKEIIAFLKKAGWTKKKAEKKPHRELNSYS